LGVAALAIVLGERRWPLRRRTQREPRRQLNNLVLGAAALATVQLLEAPVVHPLACQAERRRVGLAQRLPLPAAARDAIAFLLLDYTVYVWHVLTHRVPALWRFHLVHHIDLDLDWTTALRFHAADMAISVPYRALQVVVIGASRRALAAWQAFFFLSVLFHHSNLRLPFRLERVLAGVLTTPRMHGIHHSTVRAETESNWSSGLSIWDHLHGTFRLDIPQEAITVGVPAYRDPAELGFLPSLAMPFGKERDAWRQARPTGSLRNPAANANSMSRPHQPGPTSGQACPVSARNPASSKRGFRLKYGA
jgi:sterol desaturase/sphingolipid hydroxylase (fatty acid hydroxylase superfamily)